MIQCKLCQNECKSWGSLTKHLLYNHPKFSNQKYYDTFLKKINDGICESCSSPTTFVNISSGYHRTCSHKCACTIHRKELANDKKRHDNFVAKVSSNQSKIWEDRKETGEDKTIVNKIKNTLDEYYESMTSEERLKKYGSSMACATRMGITVSEYEKSYERLSDKEKYRKKVWQITEDTYRRNISDIDPNRIRGLQYHLDHKYSIGRGFVENIEPEIIASRHNLEILDSKINMSKNAKCSININTLRELYYVEVQARHLSS